MLNNRTERDESPSGVSIKHNACGERTVQLNCDNDGRLSTSSSSRSTVQDGPVSNNISVSVVERSNHINSIFSFISIAWQGMVRASKMTVVGLYPNDLLSLALSADLT